MPWWLLLLSLCFAVYLGSIVQTVIGFDGGLISAPIFIICLPLAEAAVLSQLVSCTLNAWIVFGEHRPAIVQWRTMWWMFPAVALGVIGGIIAVMYGYVDKAVALVLVACMCYCDT